MTSQRPNVSTQSRGNTGLSGAPPSFGKLVPNLIVHYDPGNNERLFLLQCEVPIDDSTEFETVHRGLEDKSAGKSGPHGWAEVKRIVTSHIVPGASEIFKKVIELGFEANTPRK